MHLVKGCSSVNDRILVNEIRVLKEMSIQVSTIYVSINVIMKHKTVFISPEKKINFL